MARIPKDQIGALTKKRSAQFEPSNRRRLSTCACRKSNPDIFVMQSAEDRTANNTPCPLNSAR